MRRQTPSPVVVQMVRSANNRRDLDIRKRYLKALGISDVSLYTLPSSISQEYAGQWKAFLDANEERYTDPEEHALMTFLSFVRYCRMVKVNPFDKRFNYRDPLTSSSRLDPLAIQKRIAENNLKLLFNAISSLMTKTRLKQYMVLDRKRVVPVVEQGVEKINATYILRTSNKRMTLDGVLAQLKGTLYKNDFPPQLKYRSKTVGKNKTVDACPDADDLAGSPSLIGWLPLLRTSAFEIYVTRAKDQLLLVRAVVIVGRKHSEKPAVPVKEKARMWSKWNPFF